MLIPSLYDCLQELIQVMNPVVLVEDRSEYIYNKLGKAGE